MKELVAVVRLLEFLYKAVVTYAKTPEGEQELSDIETALGIGTYSSDININPDETQVNQDQPNSQTRVVRSSTGG